MAALPAVAAAVLVVVASLCSASAAAAASPAGGPHMADLSVLLPPRMSKPVEYRLIGWDGCFTWSLDHHDIISLKPEYNDSSRCSTSARLASIAPYSGRKETSVYATDIISGITIHCKVFVDKISQIRIFHHAVKIDLDEIATLRVHAFDDEARYSTESSVNQINVPFDCKVEPSFVGFVEPWSDRDAKKSYCVFHPYSPAQLLPVKLNPKEGFLHIAVRANLKEDPTVTGSAHALFVKGFYIKEPGNLNLTPSCNHSIITVGGNTDVELFWSAKDLMSVRLLDTNENMGAPSQVVYRVEALKRQSFSDKVTIILPATGQTEEVEVGYVTGDRPEPSSSSGLTTLAVILTCIVVPIATLALFMKLLEKPARQAPSRRAAPAPAGPAVAPDPASPANGQFSPRTPQPFMEYVRKTVDDTPYYKRDARRRFNPQNTY